MEYIYGALLLHKLGQPVNEENLRKVIEAAGARVDDSKLKSLLASLNGVDIAAELENASIAVAAPVGGSAGTSDAGADATKKEEPKEESKAEAAEGLASLFG